MLKNNVVTNVVVEDAPAAPALNPTMLAKLKKEDMKQAIYERFSGRTDASPRTAVRTADRSPYWQPADDEC